jgi:hypothetical protein
MSSRLDRQLWSKIHARSLGDFTPSQFQSMLEAGANPWVGYDDRQGRRVYLLEGLCRADTADRQRMLSLWLSWVSHPDDSPSKTPALHCLPIECSLNAIDALIAAGASTRALNEHGKTPLEDFIARLHYQASGNWKAVRLLCEHSKEMLSNLDLSGHKAEKLDFLRLFFGENGKCHQEDEDLSFVLSNGNWNLDWKTSDETGKWLRTMLATQLNSCFDPGMWTRAGLDWSGRCPDGMSLLHHILLAPGRFDEYGNPILPVASLCEAIEQGADFDGDGSLGWTPRQRFNAISWSDRSGDLGRIKAILSARQLDRSTIDAARTHLARRI